MCAPNCIPIKHRAFIGKDDQKKKPQNCLPLLHYQFTNLPFWMGGKVSTYHYDVLEKITHSKAVKKVTKGL